VLRRYASFVYSLDSKAEKATSQEKSCSVNGGGGGVGDDIPFRGEGMSPGAPPDHPKSAPSSATNPERLDPPNPPPGSGSTTTKSLPQNPPPPPPPPPPGSEWTSLALSYLAHLATDVSEAEGGDTDSQVHTLVLLLLVVV
jgi:hypothetical protein